MAFLPRPCITKEQLADLSNHLHTLSFRGGKKHWSKFRKSDRALCSNALCTHPTMSPPKLSMDQDRSAEQKDVDAVGPVYGLRRRDPAGSLVQLPASQLVCSCILHLQWPLCSPGVSSEGRERPGVQSKPHRVPSGRALFAQEALACGEPQDYLQLFPPTPLTQG